jgi:hypothetical protein
MWVAIQWYYLEDIPEGRISPLPDCIVNTGTGINEIK